MILFYFIILLCVLISCRAEKKQNIKWVLLLIFVLSFLSGVRSISVGTDTHNYERIFLNILNGGTSSMEIIFFTISKFFLNLFGETRSLYIIYALITNGLIIFRLWDFRENCSFSFATFMYISVFFPQSMNILRQYLALAIIFYATRYLEKRKYLIYLLFVFIAVGIHTSSVVGFLLYIPYIYGDDHISKRRTIGITLFLLALTPIMLRGYQFLYNNYKGYISYGVSSSVSMLIVFRIIILALFWLMTMIGYGHIRVDHDVCIADNEIRFKEVSAAYTIGVIISLIGIVYQYADRLALYFIFYEILFAAMITRREKKVFFNLFFIILALYFLVIKTGIIGECGIKPYSMYFLETGY